MPPSNPSVPTGGLKIILRGVPAHRPLAYDHDLLSELLVAACFVSRLNDAHLPPVVGLGRRTPVGYDTR